MTPTDEQLQDQADQLDDLARRLAALEGRQAAVTRTELEARLTPGTPARAGAGTVLGGLALGMVSQAPGNAAPYASTLRPVAIVAVLPTLPNADFPPGCLVLLTTDAKIYRNDANSWSKALDGADLVANSVTAGKLTIGAYSPMSLVPNYSFEDAAGGQPVAWSVWDAGGTSSGYSETTTAVVKEGALALTLQANAGAGNRYAYRSALFPVEPSDKLFCAAWYRFSATATTGAYFRLQWFKADGTASATAWTDVVGGVGGIAGVYNQARGYVSVPADATQALVVLYLYQPDVTTFLTWDEIVVQRTVGGVRNSTAETIIDENGITVTNGKIVVTNAGATVIIDGTSNMFKIAATGTLTLAFPAAPGNSVTTVTLTALGAAFVTSPVMLSQMTLVSGGVTDARYGHFVADVVNTTGHVNYHAHNNIHLDASPGQAVVGLQTFSNLASPATTAALRYYVLIEAGI